MLFEQNMSITRGGACRCLFLSDERGATAIEYSIVAAGIALVVAPIVYVLGSTVFTNLYQQIANAFG